MCIVAKVRRFRRPQLLRGPVARDQKPAVHWHGVGHQPVLLRRDQQGGDPSKETAQIEGQFGHRVCRGQRGSDGYNCVFVVIEWGSADGCKVLPLSFYYVEQVLY